MPSISSEAPLLQSAPAADPAATMGRRVLVFLIAVNLFNYVDRQVLYALLPDIQAELLLTDAQAGRLASAFMIIYMLVAPPIGYLADRTGRKNWIAVGAVLGSMATIWSGLARGYGSLFAARAACGIGESGYGTTSPSFVAEHFPPERRAWVLSLFSMAIPVGSALGYVLGGAIGHAWGWRTAFLVVGVAGLILSLFSFGLKEPPRAAVKKDDAVGAIEGYRALFKVPSFALVTLAGAAMTFALGGFAVWVPSFYHRNFGMNLGQAGTIFGGVTVVSGIIGSLLGGWLSERVLRWTSKAHFVVSGAGLLLGMPIAAGAMLAPTSTSSIVLLFFAELFLFLNMGPLNAVIVSVSQQRLRSMAFAANIFVIHALGDAISPAIIGAMSDRMGLKPALVWTCLALGVAGAFCYWGTRHYDRDAERAARC